MTAIHFENAGGSIAGRGRHSVPHLTSNAVGRLGARLHDWRRRAKDRAQLAALDDRMLADIGITRAEAQFLSDKPFWRK
jgi:uncharacterized protein YjiS (DUF1127 family)